jgi:DNA recombination protein RmuC
MMNSDFLFVGLLLLAVADVAAAIFLARKFDRRDDTKELAIFLQTKLSEQSEKFAKELGELRLSLQKNEGEKSEELSKKLFGFFESSNKNITDTIAAFRLENQNTIEALNKKVDLKLTEIGGKVEERLTKGFEKTGETFTEIVKSIAAIGVAQKNIEKLSGEVVSLQSVLTDKKTRGIFGEKQLEALLKSVFGENSPMFALQKKLDSGSQPDATLFLPEPIGKMAVDSKFPLENYNRMFDQNLDENTRKEAQKEFKINIKKHINDIATKYIVAGETADMAVMFLPAEAIFAEIYANFYDIVEEAHQKRVWLASPTTFLALITTAQAAVRSSETGKQAEAIQTELKKLSEEFGRFESRWQSLKGDIEKVSKDVDNIDITAGKITKAFGRVEKIEFDS